MMSLNSNTMREVYFNTDQICEIFETLCGEKIDLSTYTKPKSLDIDTVLDILTETFITNVCRYK